MEEVAGFLFRAAPFDRFLESRQFGLIWRAFGGRPVIPFILYDTSDTCPFCS
jgi:hypothetical protein